MLSTTIWASYEASLWEVLPGLWERPWFKATIIDFYLNQFIIVGIIYHIERSWIKALLWSVLGFCFGSMFSALYFAWYLLKNKSKTQQEQNT
jgi:hypothetical protein